MMIIVLMTAAFALALAFVLGTALGFFKDFFDVPVDPLVANIREALPGANCGACGNPGCDGFAAAVAAGTAKLTGCPVGGSALAAKLAALTGSDAGDVLEVVAVLACQGSFAHAPTKGTYTGIATCRGAKIATGGTKLCSWGCMGYGDCKKVCMFGAISISTDTGLPVIDQSKCTGCRMCANECPQAIIKLVSADQKGAMALCSNVNSNKPAAARSCKISCIKCNQCEKNCPKQCINLGTNIPVVDYLLCDSCGTCAEKCARKSLKIIEKDIIPQLTA